MKPSPHIGPYIFNHGLTLKITIMTVFVSYENRINLSKKVVTSAFVFIQKLSITNTEVSFSCDSVLFHIT